MNIKQRLRKKRRGVLAPKANRTSAPVCGATRRRTARARSASRSGRIAVGCRADWLVLDAEHPAMAGAAADAALDHLLFAGADKAIRDVMVGGRWVVKNGRHAADERLRARFRPRLWIM